MKKILMLSAMALAVSNGVAMAEEGGKHHRKMPNAEEMFNKLDEDGNGSISKEEFVSGHEKRMEKHKERMEKIDTDGDGEISDDERAAAKEKWKEKRKERRGDKYAE